MHFSFRTFGGKFGEQRDCKSNDPRWRLDWGTRQGGMDLRQSHEWAVEPYARTPVDNRVGAEATVMGRLLDAGQEEQQIRAEPAAVEWVLMHLHGPLGEGPTRSQPCCGFSQREPGRDAGCCLVYTPAAHMRERWTLGGGKAVPPLCLRGILDSRLCFITTHRLEQSQWCVCNYSVIMDCWNCVCKMIFLSKPLISRCANSSPRSKRGIANVIISKLWKASLPHFISVYIYY